MQGAYVRVIYGAQVKIAKKLKKSNVNVDIVNFGETVQNTEILEAFMQVYI